jgi:hypothetical protein
MQTDIWLTEEVSHPERCPLCSEPLKKGSTTCLSCGFSTHPPTGSSVWIDPAIYGNPLSSSRRQSSQANQQTGVSGTRLKPQPKRQPNPLTPIPLRASAQPANAAPGSIVMANQGDTNNKRAVFGKGKQQREGRSGSTGPHGEVSAHGNGQKNATVWEYESSDFQAASSLPTLSLLISEAPTKPELTSRGNVTRRLPHIDEIDTTPALKVAGCSESSKSLVPLASQHGVTASGWPGETTIHVRSSHEYNPSSWTAGEGSQSSYARLISSRSQRKKPQAALSLNPIDRVRWWLLRPGRIEFVLWLAGTFLLVGVTCLLFLVTVFSFEWLAPGFTSSSSTNMTGNTTRTQQQATAAAIGGMIVTRTDTGPLLPGGTIRIRGQGFSSHGHISFLFDGTQPLLDQNGKSTSTQADEHGVFTTTLLLNVNLPWQPGAHFIGAQDLVTKHSVRLYIILDPGPIGKGVSSTPVSSSPPAITPTSIPVAQPTSGPGPVGITPAPVTPTPHPGTPAVTPTVGSTPTVTPTVGNTPTVTPTAGHTPTVTPTVKTTLGLTSTASPTSSRASGLGYALDHRGDLSLGKQLTHLSPWVWLMMVCYSLSMVLLGLAGVLHKRRS